MPLCYRPCDRPDYDEFRHTPPSPDAIRQLNAWGVITPAMRFLKGLPQIHYVDLTRDADEEVDLDDFKGSITIPNWLDSSLDLHMVPETTRFTVVKWGPEPHQRGRIFVAERNWLSATVISYCSVTIDKDQAFAPGVVIMDCAMHPVDPRRSPGIDNCYMAPVHIQESVWLGAHTIVMPGVTIGHHSTIGARSVVTHDIPPHSVALGNPAQVVMRYDTQPAPGGRTDPASSPPSCTMPA